MKVIAALMCAPLLRGADPDFTIMLIPDTQYLVQYAGSTILTGEMNWIKNNLTANLGNTDQGTNLTLATKFVIGLGDASQQASSGEFTDAKGTSTTNYGILDANSVPFVQPPGNHDYVSGTTDHTVISTGYTSPNGVFSADYRKTKIDALPAASKVTWGDKYDQANFYVRLAVGSAKFLIFSIEYQPRDGVLTWAKGVHDANYGWSCIITTHSYLTHNTTLGHYTGESGNTATNNDNGGAGLSTSQAVSGTNGAGDTFNSGYGMWNSSLQNWSQLTAILNGHWIAVESHYADSPATYHYQTLAQTSASSRGQSVRSIFFNMQDTDYTYNDVAGSNEYPSWRQGTASFFTPDIAPASTDSPGYYATAGATFRCGHVMVLQVRPSLGTIEGYAIATSNGRWEPTAANYTSHMSTSPIRLFSVSYALAKRPIFPMGAAVGPQ